MPSILTHYGFNKLVFNNNIKFLNNNEDVYLVGAQGPDPFFFYGVVPFFKHDNSKLIRGYGTKLHKLEPSKVFEFFFNFANKSEAKDILYSYILGSGLHYILDRNIHPYVFYKTGFSEDKGLNKRYLTKHTLFETHLDVLLINGYFKNYKVESFSSIKCDEDKIYEVSKMYEQLAKKMVVEDSIKVDSFKDAYDQMVKIEKLLYSKKGIKKGIVNILFHNTPFNTMMHPLSVKDDIKIDYLNLDKKEWKDPAKETSYNKSIIDLIEESKKEVEVWENIVNSYYENKGNYNDLVSFTKNILYDGHEVGMKKKVFDSVYK